MPCKKGNHRYSTITLCRLLFSSSQGSVPTVQHYFLRIKKKTSWWVCIKKSFTYYNSKVNLLFSELPYESLRENRSLFEETWSRTSQRTPALSDSINELIENRLNKLIQLERVSFTEYWKWYPNILKNRFLGATYQEYSKSTLQGCRWWQLCILGIKAIRGSRNVEACPCYSWSATHP